MNSTTRRVLFITIAVVLLAGCSKKQSPPSDESAAEPSTATRDTVTLGDESLKLIALETIVVKHGPFELTLPAPGRVSFNRNRTAQVSSTLEGRIVKMNYDVGATVHEGDVMAIVDSPEMLSKPLELKAPAGGEVTARNGTVGEIIDRARELYTISDPASVWVIADVSANEIAGVRAGQTATLHTTGAPNAVSHGKVVMVSPTVTEESRTVEVRIEPDVRNPALIPGIFVDVEIVTGTLPNMLVVPDAAVQRIGDQEIVFVVADPHTFVKRPVKTGRTQSGNVEIIDGLRDGESVVTKGSFLLKSELLKSQLGE
jgi:cobalt-zinc-cadmium efflux system membrane fusion protein